MELDNTTKRVRFKGALHRIFHLIFALQKWRNFVSVCAVAPNVKSSKTLMGFCEVVDSVSVLDLDSVELDSKSM
ncbi:hypothetical protein [uncultured Helicobacter sp.]|uniref:hypothetical protein n=1 Tax=uncultured Helicobacter sp. TaxID=175537 RepID=UPI00374EE148